MFRKRLGAGSALLASVILIGMLALGLQGGFSRSIPSDPATIAMWEDLNDFPKSFHSGLSPSDPSRWLEFAKPVEFIPERLRCGCFAPGTPVDAMDGWFDNLIGDAGATAYHELCRWSGPNGSPRALTWSFAPDGVIIPNIQGFGSGTNELFSRLDALFGGNRALWVFRFQQSFDRWEELCGTSYTRITVPGEDWDDGATWGSTGSTFRGDIRIGMKNLDGGSGTLAFNPFPCSSFAGDMVLDRAENWAFSSSGHRFLRNVAMHEHGHGLGILHVCPGNGTKLMEPFLNTNFDGPQQDDIRAAQFLYGDPFESDNNTFGANVLGDLEPGSPITVGNIPGTFVSNASTLSIDANGEQDYFEFTLTEGRNVTATVNPIGSFYDNATQAGNGSCNSGDFVNAIAIANLNVEIRDTDGLAILALGNSAGAGQSETAEADILDAGTYYVRVIESSTPTESQLYKLVLTAAELDPCLLVECDDDVFCNGAETCSAGDCFPGTAPCNPPDEVCNEESNICQPAPGGCCLADGSCEIQQAFDCTQNAGFYYGNGSDCVDLDPPCEPAPAEVTCVPSSAFVFPGTSTTVTLFLTEVPDLATYQMTIDVNQISGTGTATLDCSLCSGAPNEPDCAVRVDESRGDYVFLDENGFAAVSCFDTAGGAVLLTGSAAVDVSPGYLIEYEIDISEDADPGSQFEVSVVTNPDNSFLIKSNSDFVPYRTGDPCTLTVADAGDCIAPVVTADGSKTVLITPQGGAPQALLVTGDPGDPDVGCVSLYVQADGTLGPSPFVQTPSEWGTVGAHGEAIIPEKLYNVQADCTGELSSASSATTWKWGDVESPPNNVINFADIFLVVQAFQLIFDNVTLERADLEPCEPNRVANLADVQKDVQAFQGQSYVASGCPLPCP